MMENEFYWTTDPMRACSFADYQVVQRVALGMEHKGPEDVEGGLAWEEWEWIDIVNVAYRKFARATYWYDGNRVVGCYIARRDGNLEDHRTC